MAYYLTSLVNLSFCSFGSSLWEHRPARDVRACRHRSLRFFSAFSGFLFPFGSISLPAVFPLRRSCRRILFQIPPGHFHVIDPIRIYARFEPSHYRYRVICFPDPARFFTCTSVSPLVPIMYHKNSPFARRKLVQISQVSLVRSADFILFAQFMVDIRSYTVVY